jgi:hypothetical protein
MDESTIDYLKRHLRAAGQELWPEIAREVGVAKTLPRKIAYGDRRNPGVQTIEPLLVYFRQIDRGERQLPRLAMRAAAPVAALAQGG